MVNRNIKVDNRSIFFKHSYEKGVNFGYYIIQENCAIKSWNELKNELKLEQRVYFKWV